MPIALLRHPGTAVEATMATEGLTFEPSSAPATAEDLLQHLVAVVLGVGLFLLLSSHRRRSRGRPPRPPQAPGYWPLIGHTWTIVQFFKDHPGQSLDYLLADWVHSTGHRLMRFRLLQNTFVVVSDPAVMQEVSRQAGRQWARKDGNCTRCGA